MTTYEEYLGSVYALSFEDCCNIHGMLLESTGRDKDAADLYQKLLVTAYRYANIRAEWTLLTREEKADTDAARTAAHDSVITHINMLSRYLKQQGKDIRWRDMLGYTEDDPALRRRIGDFACYLAFIAGLCAR